MKYIMKVHEMFGNTGGTKTINESFNSKMISDLFRNGELPVKDKRDIAILNQLTDDEVIGVADTKEDAKKLLRGKLGDQYERRYHQSRHVDGDGDPYWEMDYDKGYWYNKTDEGYMNYLVKLKNGKFLVLCVTNSELSSRFEDIRFERWCRRPDDMSNLQSTKLLKRKDFVNKNKDDIKEYHRFKRFMEDRGLFDEFVKTTNDILADGVVEIYKDGNYDAESEICRDAEYEAAGFSVYMEYVADIYYSDMVVTPYRFVIYDGDGETELFDFRYGSSFERNTNQSMRIEADA